MPKRPTDEELGKYARAEMLLRQHVSNGVRPVGAAVRRLQAAIDDKPYPDPELAALTSKDGLAFEELQLVRFSLLNRGLKLNFSKADLLAVAAQAPSINENVSADSVPVLCWRVAGSLTAQVFSYYLAMRRVYGAHVLELSDGEGDFSSSHYVFKCSDGGRRERYYWTHAGVSDEASVEPKLWWETIDLLANSAGHSRDVAIGGAGLSVLAAACLHSDFFRRHQDVEFDVPGLRFNSDQAERGTYRFVPTLAWCKDGRHLHWNFDDENCDGSHPNSVVPVRVSSS